MKNPPENEFRDIRRLLALKRYEQPPPGYFNNLPREIIAKLKADRYGENRTPASSSPLTWLDRFLNRLQAQPAFAGACGALLGAVLIGGILLGEGTVQKPAAMPSLITDLRPVVAPTVEVVAMPAAFQPVAPGNSLPMMETMESTNLPQRPSLFDLPPFYEPVTVDHRP